MSAADEQVITLTEFGRAFVRACRPPAQCDPEIKYHDEASVDAVVEKNRERWAAEDQAATASPETEIVDNAVDP